jgi:bacterioferritin-associated ferredoxin
MRIVLINTMGRRPAPTAMYICLCNAITEGQVREAAERGARSPDDLAHELGVGLGCGRCVTCAKALLCETIARTAGPAPAKAT